MIGTKHSFSPLEPTNTDFRWALINGIVYPTMIENIEHHWNDLLGIVDQIKDTYSKASKLCPSEAEVLELARHFQLISRLESIEATVEEIEEHVLDTSGNTSSLSDDLGELKNAVEKLKEPKRSKE
jgi:hypothetical protein